LNRTRFDAEVPDHVPGVGLTDAPQRIRDAAQRLTCVMILNTAQGVTDFVGHRRNLVGHVL
jgi:hypothetical protein